MRPLPRILVAGLALAGGGCVSPESDTAEGRMLERRDADTWVETDTNTPEGRRALRAELGGARGAVVAAMPRFEERTAAVFQDEPRRPDSRPVEPPLPAWPGPRVAVVFADAPLKDIVAAVAAEMKVNVILPDDLVARASVNFPSIDPLAGLDLLLRRHGKRIRFEQGVLSVVDYARPRMTQT